MIKLKIGDPAPDFSLPSSTNKSITLHEFRGKKIVLYFYPKDDTPGCTIEACDFRNSHDSLETSGIQILGISADGIESHKKFSDKFSLNFPLISDADKSTINAYGAWSEKQVLGKTELGIKRMTFLIDEEGKILKIWETVNPDGHAEEILKASNSG